MGSVYKERYGISGADVTHLIRRFYRYFRDSDWQSADDFVRWCSENGWQKGLRLYRRNKNRIHGPDNSFFKTPEMTGRAKKEDIRKQAKRELNAGKMELKEYNDLVRALRGRCDDDDFIDGLADYNRQITIALGALNVEKGFRLSQHDLRDISGRNAWEQSFRS